jgi:hypothetical protein
MNSNSKFTEYVVKDTVEYTILTLNETTLLYTYEGMEQNKKQLYTLRLVKQ